MHADRRSEDQTPKRPTDSAVHLRRRNRPQPPQTPSPSARRDHRPTPKYSSRSDPLSCTGAPLYHIKSSRGRCPNTQSILVSPATVSLHLPPLLLFYPQRKSLLPPHPLPPPPRHSRPRRCPPSAVPPLLTRLRAASSHISSSHIMSAPAETETKPVEPAAPVVEASTVAPTETAAPAAEHKKEVRVIPPSPSLPPLTRAFALSGGPKAHCECPLACFVHSSDFPPGFVRSPSPLPLRPRPP